MNITLESQKISKRQWILLAYLPIHLLWYFINELLIVDNYHVVHSVIDDMIPFCEWFIFIYLLWFVYMLFAGLCYLIKDPHDLEKYLLALWIGFFIATLTNSIYPTGQDLRPLVYPRDNIATWIVGLIQGFDTNTNVFPSMHIIGASVVAFSISKSNTLGKKKWINIISWIYLVLVTMSTVFLKQHSILDVFGGFAVSVISITVVYKGWASTLLTKVIQLFDKSYDPEKDITAPESRKKENT